MRSSADFDEISRRLTDNAKQSLRKAGEYAREDGSRYVGTEYLLLGIIGQKTSFAAQILEGSGMTFAKARRSLTANSNVDVLDHDIENPASVSLSETTKLTLKMSIEIANEFHQNYCGTEHILFSLLAQKNSRSRELLSEASIDIFKLQQELEDFLYRQQSEVRKSSQTQHTQKRSKTTILDALAVDLTAQARAGRIDTVVGRDSHIDRMMVILGRKSKNNPILVGEPGVGKTAIVEGLALKIANDDVPESLIGKSVYQLQVANLIAGTKYRGEFEDRLQKLVNHLKSRSDVILFIDEVHQLVGAGTAEGSMDASNILKPSLARGNLRMIGATTRDEFNKYVEADKAFERRLQKINVEPTSPRETVAILRGIRHHYQDHHGVEVDDETLDMLVDLADRYISEHHFPDKAIDVLDEASSEKRTGAAALPSSEKTLLRQIRSAKAFINRAVQGEDYETAARSKLELIKLENSLKRQQKKRLSKNRIKLSHGDIHRTVARISGLPTLSLEKADSKQLALLDKALRKKIIAQDQAVDQVVRAVRRSAAGIARSDKPYGSFIFTGPSGVGKTELAKQLAQSVFGDKKALLKIDMSEMGEQHTVSRLLGAPAGYVGYGEKNQLVDFVRQRPYSVILFDEIEKAHPSIFNVFLQILDEGRLTDGKGREVDFTKTIIIMTSNIGSQQFEREATMGFVAESNDQRQDLKAMHKANAEKVMEEVKEHFRPEFLNRLDTVVVFNALTHDDVRKIAKLQVADLAQRLAKKGIGLKLSRAAVSTIVDQGFSVKQGARGIEKALVEHVEDVVAEKILLGDVESGQVVHVKSKAGKLEYEIK